MKKIKYFTKVIVVLMIMGCIFYLSSQSGTASSAFSNPIMRQLRSYVEATTWLPSSIKRVFLGNPVVWTRKLAHFIIYLVLGGASYLALPKDWSIPRRITLGISLCFIYAVTDELHQLFVPGRSAQLLDVFIDTLGSSVGLAIGYLIKNKFVMQKK